MKTIATASIALLITWITPGASQESAADPFYPVKVGNVWTYRATDLKAPQPKPDAKRTIIEVEREEKYTYKEVGGDGKDVEKSLPGFMLKQSNGDKVQRVHVYVTRDGVYQASVAGRSISPPLLLLKSTVKFSGETWPWDSTSGTTAVKGTCTIRSENVRVPYKKEEMPARVVLFTNDKAGDDRHEVETWFVPNVGMVKQRIAAKNHATLLELESFVRAK
ncbi:MAG: hypothetical protein HY289_07650 [Planctomycetes bacterium]|nr:hypothetical protein [Planctomycetota bacterium]